MTIQIELISESELADESFNIVINGLDVYKRQIMSHH